MEAIYFVSFKMIPSTTTFEDMLDLSNVIILPCTSTFKIRVSNGTFDKGVITEKASRIFPVPERDLPGIPWDKDPEIDEPYIPGDPGETPPEPWDEEDTEGSSK